MSIWLTVAAMWSFAVFSINPELDLFVSSLFYEESIGFSATFDPRVVAGRRLLWGASQILVLSALFGLVANVWTRRELCGVPTRVWTFVLAVYALGPGLMVDLIAKPLWGRARPRSVVEFGGELPFTTPIELVDHCTRNCSFVSGEVSGATAFSISLVLIAYTLQARLPAILFRTALGVAILMPILSALQRISAGAHFLSDTIFAIVFTCWVAVSVGALLRLTIKPASMPGPQNCPASGSPP
ncbi:MAG: phosphatase PAP2 family protein [Rhizobium sp.]|nr:phosphatase PAP2 family protein [Rhizobium sp.]